MTYIRESLRRLVYERAKGRCEYCLLHNDLAYAPHEIDHIFAEKHSGATDEANLCLSCAVCNRCKGSDVASVDPATGEVVPLFHPRRHQWSDHFALDGAVITPLTPTGRVTIRLLQINDPERVLEREIYIKAGRYP